MTRTNFTDKELSSSIYQCKPKSSENTNINELAEQTVIYTITGKQDTFKNGLPVILDEKNKFSYAKKNNKRYYIKSNGSQFIDPLGLYVEKDSKKRIGDESIWKWKEVNYKVFSLYVKFLQTKNKSYYYNSLREMF